MMAYTVALIASPCTAARGSGSTAVELSDSARVNLLPLPARNERGEGWGEGKPERKCPSSPRPSPPAAGGEGGPCALSALLSLNSTAVGSGRGIPGKYEIVFKQCFQGFPLSPPLSPLLRRWDRETPQRRQFVLISGPSGGLLSNASRTFFWQAWRVNPRPRPKP